MGDATSITLNVTEILALLAIVWGLGKMSQKLDGVVTAVESVTHEVSKIVSALAGVMERVGILEDRDDREGPRSRRR